MWCNPPYSNCGEWVEKAWAEQEAELVVMLLPANRTEQKWWQEMVEPFRDRPDSPLRTEFIAGRIRFITAAASRRTICNAPRLPDMAPLREVTETIYYDDVVRVERLSCGHTKSTMTSRDRPARRRRCFKCEHGEPVK